MEIEGFEHHDYSLPRQPYSYNGKEELLGGLLDFGARLMDPAMPARPKLREGGGRFLSVDPNAERYYVMSPYSYVYNNPIGGIDPDGKDGILIVFPDMLIEYRGKKYRNLGHAGVLLIDNSGYTKYYEYGRYGKNDADEVINHRVSNVVIGPDGKPTEKSLNKVLKEISNLPGNRGRIEGAYVRSDDFEAMLSYAKEMTAKARAQENYNTFTNNCATFACDVLNQDEDVRSLSPWILDPRPNSVIGEYQDEFDRVYYNSETDSYKYEVNEKYYQKYIDMIRERSDEEDEE